MSTEKEQIQQTLDKIVKGVINRDWTNTDPYIADNYTLFENGDKMTWEEQKKMFEENIDNHDIETSIMDLHISNDGSMAWCTISESTTYKFKGEYVEQSAINTLNWEKIEGTWKLIHFSRSVNPANIPSAMKEEMAEEMA